MKCLENKLKKSMAGAQVGDDRSSACDHRSRCVPLRGKILKSAMKSVFLSVISVHFKIKKGLSRSTYIELKK